MNTKNVIVYLLLVISCSSCSSVYWGNRGRDARDIAGLSVEWPMIGGSLDFAGEPIGLGFGDGKGIGLREGHVGSYEFTEVGLLLYNGKIFKPINGRSPRGGRYAAAWFWPFNADLPERGNVELVAGLGLGLRAGIDFQQLLDFFLGWFGVDFMEDDTKLEETAPSEILSGGGGCVP